MTKLKNGKASGMDMMSDKFIKVARNIIALSLCDIFNSSIEKKVFPHDFKTAVVTPIFKSGEVDNLGNYRPISVLSTIAQIFEKLLYTQLYQFLTDNDILGNKQWGFTLLQSTASALINCSNEWLINIDQGKLSSTVLLDIKKAFDTIDHKIFLTKMDHYGIRDEELGFFNSYLIDRQQCCSVNNCTSSFKKC